MFITPEFTLTQDDTSVTLTAHTPHIHAQQVELDVDGPQITLHAKPYFLRIALPGPLIDDDLHPATAQYHLDSGSLVCHLCKLEPGEVFHGLELIETLLKQQRTEARSTGIVLDDGDDIADIASHWDIIEEGKPLAIAEAREWRFVPFSTSNEKSLVSAASYGFNNAYSGIFTHIQHDSSLLRVVDIESSTRTSRREARLDQESDQFDEDHYMADFIQDAEIRRLFEFESGWDAVTLAGDASPIQKLEFTDEELAEIGALPRKSFMIENDTTIYLGLIDLLFAYAYDCRINEGEVSSESGWNIIALSGTLSCMDQFECLRTVVMCCFRRALAYPLYRHWDLAKRVLSEVVMILKHGKRGVMRALLAMRRVLADDEEQDRISRVWLLDYCIWIRTASNKQLLRLAADLAAIEIRKSEVDWKLDEWDALSLEDAGQEEASTSSSEGSDIESDASASSSESADEDDVAVLSNGVAAMSVNASMRPRALIEEIDSE